MAKREQSIAERQTSRVPDLVHFELNMEEAPLFASLGQNADILELSIDIVTDDGQALTRTWRVSASREYGFPGPFEEDVWVAVGKLVQSKGGMPEDGQLRFTIYELIQILGLPKKGDNYPRVRDAILRIQKTQIDAINAFYSKEKLAYDSEHFSPWRVHFEMNADRYGRATERHSLRFDEVLVRSFRAGHIKPLDVDFYLSLANSYSKSLFRRIDSRRGNGLRWVIKLDMLKQLLSMPASYKYPSKIKEKLVRAHDELTERGYLRSVTYPSTDEVCYEVSKEFVEQRIALEHSWSAEENTAIRSLIKDGVWPNVARELVSKYGAELCGYYVEVLPYQKNVRDAGAWLNHYISNQLPPPVEPSQRRLEQADLGSRGDHLEHDLDYPPPAPEPSPQAQNIFDAVLEDVSAEIDTPSFTAWFQGTVPVSLEDKRLTLLVPNSFAEEYIRTRFAEKIEEGLRGKLGEGARLSITVYG